MDKDGADVPPSRRQLLPYLRKFFSLSGTMLMVWGVGYFKFSIAWVVVGLFCYMLNEEYRRAKTEKKAFAKVALANEKAAILARTDELPSWVFFPDVERAEWLNKMIRQMWPFIGEYVKEVLKTMVQPSVENSLPNSLKPFKFERIDLGDIPPRIGGVKVYIENVKRDEIILDMELFYAGDADIKVAVRGLTAGIKELTIHGHLRLVMKPLVKSVPIIGGINIFFLNQPSIDFDLTDCANLLDMPLLSNTLRSVLIDQVSNYLVLPNKIPVQLAQNISTEELLYPIPQGVMRLHVIAGRELKTADVKLVGKGKSDPYCKLYVGSQSFKTKVIQNSINPVWNSYFEAVVDQKHGQFAEFEVLDEDPGDDDELGTASVDIQHVAEHGSMDSWLPLENVNTGMIHIRALWLHLSKDPNDLDKEDELRKERMRKEAAINANYKEKMGSATEDTLSSALLLVHLDSAKALPRTKKSMSEPSPFVKLSVGNITRKSIPKPKTTDPKWEENFQFLINDPRHQDLEIEIMDSNRDKRIGALTVALNTLLSADDMIINRPYQLRDSAAQAKLNIRLCLRVLTSEVPAEWAQDKHTCVEPETPTPTEQEQSEAAPLTANGHRELPIDVGEPDKDRNFYLQKESDLGSNTSSPVMERTGSELRHRTTAGSSGSEQELGRIQVTIRYSPQRNKLITVIHKCMSLMACDSDNLSDPYVKMYLLPERSSSSKRKTQVVKNNLNPIYDETFEWSIKLQEAKERTLEISVKNSKGVFSQSRTLIGKVYIDLSQLDLTRATTQWYDLMGDTESFSTTV